MATIFFPIKKNRPPIITPTLTLSTKEMWGQPVKTMFPAIDSPVYIADKSALGFLQDSDEVYVLRYRDQVLVYPAMILGYHHIVNDAIDGNPIAITSCLLSDSSLWQ